ncbi:MAG: Rrf2 family transcriptional regulator [Planctomycetes bacterium]|nr:Rrf2 family transcriptional regulator [Planctomycetota bacterium]
MLQLTSVYGLRAMAVLAGLAPGESITASDLSAATRVPQQYLSKVMRKLVVARLVRGRRGRNGGFQLAKAPRAITIAMVLNALSHEIEGGCAFGFPACDPDHPCALHPIWSRLQQCVGSWSSEMTLADMDPDGRRISRDPAS